MAKRKTPNDSNASDDPRAPQEPVVVPEWAMRLRERAREIGMTDIAVARRVGLLQNRYASYVAGTREPDLMTFARICEVLGTKADIVLGLEPSSSSVTTKDAIRARVISALEAMDAQYQKVALACVEAMAEATLPEARAKQQTPKPSRRHLL